VVNALSEWLEVKVDREGRRHEMTFERGKKSSDLKVTGKSQRTGHGSHLQGGLQIFPDIEFKYEILQKRMRELAYLNEGFTSSSRTSAPASAMNSNTIRA
jgi:DNA gyrase subunit B